METNSFFKWTQRINSILFLALLVISIGFVSYGFIESNRWKNQNTVTLAEDKASAPEIENLQLGGITNICGKDIQYVELTSTSSPKSFSSGGYNRTTRNIIFFSGEEMNSHWLFDKNDYLIDNMDQLRIHGDDCKDKETVAIYYEIRKSDSNKDQKIDENDLLDIALSLPDGSQYKEIESNVTSVLDHSMNDDGSVLTVLVQVDNTLFMKKYQIKTMQKISEKEINKIIKNR